MSPYDALFARVLTRIDPETAHAGAARLIALAGLPGLAACVRTALGVRSAGPGRTVFGRQVTSPLGIAAGFDKNAQLARGLAAMGFGFVEVGTVTARAQAGNDRPRLFRIPERRALHNRMGFNNDGAEVIAARLARLRRTPAGKRLVLGVNIGKSRTTPAAQAVADYEYSAARLAPFADYLVVNVSSPNTPGLRDLQAVAALAPILRAVQDAANHAAARSVPVMVKIAPDLADADVAEVGELVGALGLAGIVAANTTIAHDYGPGGLSGPMLLDRGVDIVWQLRAQLGPGPVIIGVGGITGPAELHRYLQAGATLAQAYTGFVYGGPRWPAVLARSGTP